MLRSKSCRKSISAFRSWASKSRPTTAISCIRRFRGSCRAHQTLLPRLTPADGYGIHPIRGRQLGGRTLQLTEHSRLVIRTDAEQIARFLPLAGKQLRLLDRTLCIGVPEVRSLVPAVTLRTRLVTIKLPDVAVQSAAAAAETFRAAALRKLVALGISKEACFARQAPHAADQGQGSRRLRGAC